MAHTPHADSKPVSVSCAIITASDSRWQRIARAEPFEEDKSGNLMRSQLEAAGHTVADYRILPDEPAAVRKTLEQLAALGTVQAVLLTGGTGIAPRDTTYDAIVGLLEKELQGFGEIFRALSYPKIGSRAIASRATAGVYRQMLVFSLPGSVHAVELGMKELILPELAHLTRLLHPSL
ncbi:molybdenum cofactor biosynthesis protein B [Altericista sp. CCNU0014]|uniref:MogA/MoaB family molybdenum cofactor biosynthesis protein n=1 Tax=Altericista sp. CCNU0014 TaxID=3082949 RepID=UPI00384C0462